MHQQTPPGLRAEPSANIGMSSFITPRNVLHGPSACLSSSFSSLGIVLIPLWYECSLIGNQLIGQMFFWMSGWYLAQIYSKSGNTTLPICFLTPHTFIARSAYISHQTSGSSVRSHVKRHMCDVHWFVCPSVISTFQCNHVKKWAGGFVVFFFFFLTTISFRNCQEFADA